MCVSIPVKGVEPLPSTLVQKKKLEAAHYRFQ